MSDERGARSELSYSPWSWIDRSEATLINSTPLEGCSANLYEVPSRGTSGRYLVSVETPEKTLFVISSPPTGATLEAEILSNLFGEREKERHTVLVDVYDASCQAAYEAPADVVEGGPFLAWALNFVKQRVSR